MKQDSTAHARVLQKSFSAKEIINSIHWVSGVRYTLTVSYRPVLPSAFWVVYMQTVTVTCGDGLFTNNQST